MRSITSRWIHRFHSNWYWCTYIPLFPMIPMTPSLKRGISSYDAKYCNFRKYPIIMRRSSGNLEYTDDIKKYGATLRRHIVFVCTDRHDHVQHANHVKEIAILGYESGLVKLRIRCHQPDDVGQILTSAGLQNVQNIHIVNHQYVTKTTKDTKLLWKYLRNTYDFDSNDSNDSKWAKKVDALLRFSVLTF